MPKLPADKTVSKTFGYPLLLLTSHRVAVSKTMSPLAMFSLTKFHGLKADSLISR